MIKPYLNFDGDCEAAFRLYVEAFEGQIEYMEKYGDLAPEPGVRDKVRHAEIKLTEVGGLAGGDATWPYDKGAAVNILARVSTPEQAKKAWAVLSTGATIIMDLAPTDYAQLQGALKDKYGFSWIFNVI